ncbi:RRM domain-containing protein, partial [Podarcis lilfordi]
RSMDLLHVRKESASALTFFKQLYQTKLQPGAQLTVEGSRSSAQQPASYRASQHVCNDRSLFISFEEEIANCIYCPSVDNLLSVRCFARQGITVRFLKSMCEFFEGNKRLLAAQSSQGLRNEVLSDNQIADIFTKALPKDQDEQWLPIYRMLFPKEGMWLPSLTPLPPQSTKGTQLNTHDPLDLSNYRPVSNLPFLGKTVLVALTDDLHLSAAFDMVDHELLDHRLADVGIQGTVLQWLRSFLSGSGL